MAKEKNGSLAGSKNVSKQRTSPSYAQEHNWGGLGRTEGGNCAEGKGESHGQKKASSIAPLNKSSEGEKSYD